MQAIVNYAKTLRSGDTLVLPEGKVFVERIVNAQGRKPKVGSNIFVLGNGEKIRLNTEQPVRIIRNG